MAYSPKPKTCVWFSRHAPTPAQGRSLCEAVDAWVLITNRVKKPDLIVAVLPLGMLRQLVERANQHGVPVVQARPLTYPDGRKRRDWEWSGKWERVLEIRKETQEWTPDT